MIRLVLFDMDGTLFNGRTIFHLAEKFGFLSNLQNLMKTQYEPYKKSIQIAKLLQGLEKKDILGCIQKIPLHPHVETVLKTLQKQGIKTAIATDSYDIVAEYLKGQLHCDHAFANRLIFHDNIATGSIEIHNSKLIKDSYTQQIYSIAKGIILHDLTKKYNLTLSETMAVGDGVVDISMIRSAGVGVAFNASDQVNQSADKIINEFDTILDIIQDVMVK